MSPAVAGAVEYRLQVVNVTEEAFGFYMEGGPNADGSWARLEGAADRGEVPWGAIPVGRSLTKADPALVKVFDAVRVKAEAVEADGRSWMEFRWQGDPGKRSVWIVETRGFSPLHEVRYVGFKGTGAPRFSIALNPPFSPVKMKAVQFPTQFVIMWNGRTSLWERWVSRYLDVSDGIGAVVGVDTNPTFPDTVFLVVEQPPEPTVFKVALAWRKREAVRFPQYDAPSQGTRDP